MREAEENAVARFLETFRQNADTGKKEDARHCPTGFFAFM